MKNYLQTAGIVALCILCSFNAKGQCAVLNASPQTFNFTASGGSGSVSVQTDPSECTDYSFSQVGTFFTAYKSSFGISISCDVNTTLFSRTGRVNVGDNIVIQISQEAACPPQDPPGSITGTSPVCQGKSGTYSTTAAIDATYYNWSVSNGSVVSGQGTLSAVISFPSSGSITVSVAARNSCGSQSTAQTFPVNVVAPPAAPTSISHNPTLCAGNNYTFSVTPETGYTYEWVVDGSGYSLLDGQGTASIYVQVGSGSGFIRVRAVNSTGCKSDQYSKEVSGAAVSPVYNVSGNGSICPGASTTIHLDASALNFTYTAYRDDQVVSGESPSAVISQSGNNSSLTFGPFTQEGNYTIKASGGDCEVLMNGSVSVVFKPATPDQPGTITKSVSTLCINATASFSIAAVLRATSYTWSTSGSSTITGQGTTNANITFLSSGTQTVYVTASNECGTSPAASTSITVVANPAAPTSISHNPTLCAGTN